MSGNPQADVIALIAEAYGLPPEAIQEAPGLIGGGGPRHFTATTRAGVAVFKTTCVPECLPSLSREAHAAVIAHELGVPVQQAYPFQGGGYYVEKNGNGAIALEFLTHKDWLVTNTKVLSKLEGTASQRLVTGGVDAVMAFSANPIPAGTGTDMLRHGNTGDRRYTDIASVWNECEVVIQDLDQVFPGISSVGRNWYVQRLAEGRRYCEGLMGTPGVEYLVHGNFSPSNFAVSHDEATPPYRVLGLEYAGKTNCKELALICDASNFIGRCWPNPTLQQKLIRHLAERLNNYELMRIITIFAAFYLAKYAMQSDHAEHPMAIALLTGLQDNLTILHESLGL